MPVIRHELGLLEVLFAWVEANDAVDETGDTQSDKVQVLLQKIADLKQCAASAVTLRIDGESMSPTLALAVSDAEGEDECRS